MTDMIHEPRVQLVAATQFLGADTSLAPFDTDTDDGGSAVAEFAGRACYQSWGKPNPRTATNAGYLRHILEVGHGSVLEHGQVTFYITGISRALTHELIRHRHFSYSQQSQRFVNENDAAVVVPPLLVDLVDAGEYESVELFADTASIIDSAYERLVADFDEQLQKRTTLDGTARRKAAREAARAILPNATETRIAVSGNYRAWRHFLVTRGSEHADAEIRRLALQILALLQKQAPNVFGDFVITQTADGRDIIWTEYPSV